MANSQDLTPIGIGSLLAEAPSHTTGHTGPYPAVRLIKAAQERSSDNPHDFKQAFSRCNDESFDTTCCRLHADSLLENIPISCPYSVGHLEMKDATDIFRYFCHYARKTKTPTNHSHLPGHSAWGPFGPWAMPLPGSRQKFVFSVFRLLSRRCHNISAIPGHCT